MKCFCLSWPVSTFWKYTTSNDFLRMIHVRKSWDLEFLENVVCHPHTWLVIWPGMTSYVRNKFSLRVSKALFHFHSTYSIATEKILNHSTTCSSVCDFVCFLGYFWNLFFSAVSKIDVTGQTLNTWLDGLVYGWKPFSDWLESWQLSCGNYRWLYLRVFFSYVFFFESKEQWALYAEKSRSRFFRGRTC